MPSMSRSELLNPFSRIVSPEARRSLVNEREARRQGGKWAEEAK